MGSFLIKFQYANMQALTNNRHIINWIEIKLDEKAIMSATTLPNGEKHPRASQIEQEILNNSLKIKIFKFFYESLGDKVAGYLLVSKNIDLEQKHPAIIYNRGGTGNFGQTELRHFYTDFLGLTTLLDSGYVVITSQLQGVDDGTGKSDAGGQKDLQAILKLKDILDELDFVDMDKIGIFGASNGGYFTYKALANANWIKGAVAISAPSNCKSQIQERKDGYAEFVNEFYDINSETELTERSAISWCQNFCPSTPLLIIHGTADRRVDVSHSLNLANELYKHKKPFSLEVLAGAEHSLREYRDKVKADILNWFDRYVKNGEELPNLEPHGN